MFGLGLLIPLSNFLIVRRVGAMRVAVVAAEAEAPKWGQVSGSVDPTILILCLSLVVVISVV